MRRKAPRPGRRGFTLVEMMMAGTVMAMILGALGMMALGVRNNQSVSQNLGMSQQHARVVLNRIRYNISKSTANLMFPGFVVFSEQIGAYTYPDTIVIWKPTTTAANPNGLPCWNEVIIYSPDPQKGSTLWEITLPTNTASVPALTDLASWQSMLLNARSGIGSQRVKLTDMMRKAKPLPGPDKRGVIRFDTRLAPSATEMNEYLSGTRTWAQMKWVQDIYSPDNGLRQNWCRIELQMRGNTESIDEAIPFMGSACVYYQVKRP